MTAVRFGDFELLPGERRLVAEGRTVPIGQRAFDLLQALVDRRERLVSKSELMELVWPDVVVEENNLQVQISTLRKVLGPQAIATIPGRGYQFTAPVNPGAGAAHRPNDTIVPARSAVTAEAALFGRDDDLRAVVALVASHRLVTIVGAGGIGKSRLARAATSGLPARAWVELAGLSEPALLPQAIAQALAIPLSGRAPAIDELAQGLAPRTLDLVLDNCEHLLDAVAEIVQAAISAAPALRVVATSQEPLRLPDEQQYRLAPLAVPASAITDGARESGAVALLDARVRSIDPRFALTAETLPAAIDICRRLDGLPLAIELAAARVATLGLAAVRDRLDERFRLLTGGSRAVLRRHQTLRAALEWSHALLDAEERAVFRRLGAFAGGFTIERAQAVAAGEGLDEWAVLEALSALVDKSLVVADPGEPPRYRMLESARAYALEALAAGETASTLERHARAMRDFLARVDLANLDCELRSDEFAAQVLPELDNLRAAYAWATGAPGDVPTAIALAAHAGSLVDYAPECAAWIVPLLDEIERSHLPAALEARYWRAIAATNMVGRVPTTRQIDAARRAAALYRSLGQPRREFTSLIQLSRHLDSLERPREARDALETARSLARPEWPAELRIRLLRRDAALARIAGRADEAFALARTELDASLATGDWRLELIARTNLIDALWETGPLDDAVREARALYERVRVRPGADSDMDVLHANLFAILSEAGHIDEATRVARDALRIMARTGNAYLADWPHLLWKRGELDAAARVLGAADAEERRNGAPWQVNERRILATARSGLARALGVSEFERLRAQGEALAPAAVLRLLGAATSPAR